MSIIDKVVEKAKALESNVRKDPRSVGAYSYGDDRNSLGDKNPTKQYMSNSHIEASDHPEVRRTSRLVDIDLGHLRAKGVITPYSANETFSMDFRSIKRPLLKNAFRTDAIEVERGNLIMVTSALPGEGKTYVAVNLAISMAMEVDKKVLLVDADVLRPSIENILSIESDQGLTDLLLKDELDLSAYLLKTNIPKLTLLPAGRRHHLSTELLASEAMARITKELAERYSDRVIIFDSPPLLATTEASVLAGSMGQIVVVVEAERTTQANLRKAIDMLDSRAAIGFVLNKDPRRFRRTHYEYY